MQIAYKDFFPRLITPGFFVDEYEPLPTTVERANQWLVETDVEILNIETVVLPNIGRATGASQTATRTSGDMSSFWQQVVRVWYKARHTK
jgi:hypothetical protein